MPATGVSKAESWHGISNAAVPHTEFFPWVGRKHTHIANTHLSLTIAVLVLNVLLIPGNYYRQHVMPCVIKQI